jgi:hypothetical protein
MCGEALMTSSSDLGPPPEVWAFQGRLLPVHEALAEVGAGDVAFSASRPMQRIDG